MPPEQDQQADPGSPTLPAAPVLPVQPPHDPRLGFRRQFVPLGTGVQEEVEPLSLADQMGQGLYDDPYYKPPAPRRSAGRKRLIIAIGILLVLASIGSALIFPTIKEHNPDGLFQNSGSR